MGPGVVRSRIHFVLKAFKEGLSITDLDLMEEGVREVFDRGSPYLLKSKHRILANATMVLAGFSSTFATV